MLGLSDAVIFIVYSLCILSTLLCVVYGIVNWNKGAETEGKVDKEWQNEDIKLKDDMEEGGAK